MRGTSSPADTLRVNSLNRKFRLLQSGRRDKEFSCVVNAASGWLKNLMKGTQFQVAYGQEFCKPACRTKSAGLFHEGVGRGGEQGGVGTSANGQVHAICNDGRSVGLVLCALADDLVAKRIDAGDKRLAAVEWKSGINMRVIDIVALQSLFEASVENRAGMEAMSVCTR
jgi:hypothetical protein